MKIRINDFLMTTGILVVSFLFGLMTDSMFETDALVPMVFVLAVFLTSVITKGYLCGIIASLISTLAVNYAFTFPYFEFNFTIPENLFSAVVMLVVAIVTGALTTKLKQTEKIKADSEREKMRANLLRAVSHDLRTPLTTISTAPPPCSWKTSTASPPRTARSCSGASGTMPSGWWAWWKTCCPSPGWTTATCT